MERPERPSRHKINQRKLSYRSTTYSSESDSELNDDGPPSMRFHEPEHLDMGPGVASSSTVTLCHTEPINNEANSLHAADDTRDGEPLCTIPEPDTAMDSVRRKRPCISNAAASILLNSINSIVGSSSTGQGDDSPERHQRSDYVIRPRSFCHINNSPLFFRGKRLGTPYATSREPGSIFGGSREMIGCPSTSDTAPNCLFRRAPNAHSGSSSILRHFDDMCPTSTSARNRLKQTYLSRAGVRRIDNPGRSSDASTSDTLDGCPPLNVRNTTLYDYSDNTGRFFNCAPNDSTSRERSPERLGVAETQTTTTNTAEMISRHIPSTPDLNIQDVANDLNSLIDAHENNSGGEPMDLQANDDVIVLEAPDPLAQYIVPSSRSPSPTVPLPPTPSSLDNSQRSAESKDVPMTLQDLNQSLVSLLECPVCLDHATPPIHQCCKGHILCHSCYPRLSTCPICRSHLPPGNNRNSVMEKVAEKLMYPCKNTVTGCSQMLKLDEKQEHEEGCGFRHYACIVATCHWKGYKPELVVHLQSTHPDKLISGPVKELHVPVPAASPDGNSSNVTYHWIQSAHNEVFNVIFHVDLGKRIMKGCVIFVGAPEKAEKFTYIFELKQRVAPFRKLAYSRSTHVDTLKPGQPLCLSNDFSINIDMARLYHDYMSHAIPVHISIEQSE